MFVLGFIAGGFVCLLGFFVALRMWLDGSHRKDVARRQEVDRLLAEASENS